MSNSDIARLFRNVAAAYAIKNEAKFRFQIIAYQKAADIIENAVMDVCTMIKEDKTGDLPGIGESMRTHLHDLCRTGRVRHFEELFKEIPSAVFPLLDIPGFGPKKSFKLVSHFGLNDPANVVGRLESLAENGEIAKLDGFGEKSQSDILRSIKEYRKGLSKDNRMNLPYAGELADKLLVYIIKSPAVINAYPLGSLRRRKETIGDIDFAIATKDPLAVIKHFISYPYIDRIIEQGDTSASIIVNGNRHIDLMTMTPDNFGSLLQHFTGSKNHNVHLREYAQKKGFIALRVRHKKNGKWSRWQLPYGIPI